MKLPDFIIIGAMKSATSSLHTQLAAQPGLFMSDPKEPNFFGDDEQYARGIGWYSSLFEGAAEGDLCGESSTHYTKLPRYSNTVPRMRALLPNVKLIYVMRHPVERLVSHYLHEWTQNVIACDINDALDRYPELIDCSRYSYQLAPYFEAFGKASVLPVFVGALTRQPQEELGRVARFIGFTGPVTWKEDVGRQNVSAERMRPFRGYGLLVDAPPMVWLRRNLVPQAVRDLVKARLTEKPATELMSSNVTRLESIFDEDLAVLSTWLGVDVNCDNFHERTSSGGLEWRV
jgi:hypothetical protein